MAGQGGMHGRGACVTGAVRGKGACMARGVYMAGGHAWQVRGRYYGYGIRSVSGRYASYWNAFLLTLTVCCVLYVEYLTNRFT